MSAQFQPRRVVAILGERNAVASFAVEGMLVVAVDGEEISKPHSRPATPEEVAAIFGDGHTAQLANIEMLTQRLADQRVELLNAQEAALDQAAQVVVARERTIFETQQSADEWERRAKVAEGKLDAIAAVDRQYDAVIKPLLPAGD